MPWPMLPRPMIPMDCFGMVRLLKFRKKIRIWLQIALLVWLVAPPEYAIVKSIENNQYESRSDGMVGYNKLSVIIQNGTISSLI